MAATTFDLTAKASRGKFAVYVNVGIGTEKEWEIQGFGTEDTSLEFSPDITSFTDVIEIQHNDLNNIERSMTFEPNSIRPIGDHGKLNPILHDYIRRTNKKALSNFEVLLVYWYTTDKQADLYPQSGIYPSSLGGSSSVDFPYEIRPGGEPIFGTAAKDATGKVTFTPEEII